MTADRVSSKLWMDNRPTSRLGPQYPIIQGPLRGLSSQRPTAAVSNYGGLGSFGARGLRFAALTASPVTETRKIEYPLQDCAWLRGLNMVVCLRLSSHVRRIYLGDSRH